MFLFSLVRVSLHADILLSDIRSDLAAIEYDDHIGDSDILRLGTDNNVVAK